MHFCMDIYPSIFANACFVAHHLEKVKITRDQGQLSRRLLLFKNDTSPNSLSIRKQHIWQLYTA